MTSINKKKKSKNSFCQGVLKIKGKEKLKRIFFYSASKRKQLKSELNSIKHEIL